MNAQPDVEYSFIPPKRRRPAEFRVIYKTGTAALEHALRSLDLLSSLSVFQDPSVRAQAIIDTLEAEGFVIVKK